MTLKIQQLKRPRIRPYAFKVKRPGLNWGEKSNDKEILNVIEWIVFNIGESDSDKWEFRGYGPSFLNVYFTNEEDAIAFKLKWL